MSPSRRFSPSTLPIRQLWISAKTWESVLPKDLCIQPNHFQYRKKVNVLSSNNVLVDFLRKQIIIENEIVDSLNNSLVEIKNPEKVVPTVNNGKVRLLLDAILSDERRHHELLKMVLEILVQGETITESDWWDVLWKGVPFHGSPGG